MESKYKPHNIDNVFRSLNDDLALYIMGLSLASNDLAINLDALIRYPEVENGYFFSNSISIMRELATLMIEIKKTRLPNEFSDGTKSLFETLLSELESFADGSLVKSTLKPLRDISVHYNLNKSDEVGKLKSVLNEIKDQSRINVGFTEATGAPNDQRYLYADEFRAKVISKFLDEKITSKISHVAASAVKFVDSILTDLVTANKRMQ